MSWKVSIIRGLQAPRDLSSDAFRTLTPEKYLISALHGGAREPSAIPTCRLAELSRVQAGTTGFLASAMSTCIQDGKPTDVSECRPFVVTGNIDRYEIVPAPVRYMGETYESPWCVFRPEVISHGKWRLFSQSKLLIGGMTTRLEAAYDRIGRALGVNVYAITEWELSPTYLLALLNSAYVTHVYRTMFESKHLAGGYLAINKGQLEEIPMRRILFATSQNERARLLATGRRRVESRVRPLDTECGKGAYQVFLGSELGQWVSTRLEVEPEQSDVIHDLLAHLADQMIDMNETKQAEAKGFLGWLEGYTGLPIEHWRLKTRVKAYWEHGWDEIRRALRQNRKTIEKASGRNVEGREALEAIQRELEQSVARLTPALERIASTDRLIDLIVYRLYGLTEEEVAMVEGE